MEEAEEDLLPVEEEVAARKVAVVPVLALAEVHKTAVARVLSLAKWVPPPVAAAVVALVEFVATVATVNCIHLIRVKLETMKQQKV